MVHRIARGAGLGIALLQEFFPMFQIFQRAIG
jgi:hypothetical protein